MIANHSSHSNDSNEIPSYSINFYHTCLVLFCLVLYILYSGFWACGFFYHFSSGAREVAGAMNLQLRPSRYPDHRRTTSRIETWRCCPWKALWELLVMQFANLQYKRIICISMSSCPCISLYGKKMKEMQWWLYSLADFPVSLVSLISWADAVSDWFTQCV